ncbi:ABC transporter ATP-binding protein [Tepidanaerobacter syntrophicus]|uniref:ABC transporter ATP-binding protein n=1 Tax=Tepidanaerobacter syntrophicus TaxID=224999 RepID=UPI0022EF9AAB|nr:ABC transporter ATP-binding protein [Tepidanaerobacter syntrophicus]GLI51857.1 ABC transporter ATP-binding protein [Tepidanaerobacter syntrophicus]
MTQQLLEAENLKVYFYTPTGIVKSVNGVSFSVDRGKTLGIVGESGSGKSVTVSTIMKLVPAPGKIISGKIIFKDKDLIKLNEREMLKIRGNEISMIFQDPMTALNPVFTIGEQIMESIILHQKLDKKAAQKKAAETLELVGVPDAELRLKSYPHEFSGGMRQRAMIAMAIACNPSLLIADEPTTALDVTVQAQVLELLKDLQKRLDMSIILITHNLGVVWEICHDVMVMYAGNAVEHTDTRTLYENPLHPYTWGLLDSMPKLIYNKETPLNAIEGSPPDLRLVGRGCSFAPRCPYRQQVCFDEIPMLKEIEKGHKVSCHFQDESHRLSRRSVVHNG